MPPNFGVLPELQTKIKNKQERYGQYSDRSLDAVASWLDQVTA
jgi:methylenetetrahydrofolate--tRNA-(uracil-5-)-methyltransferase